MKKMISIIMLFFLLLSNVRYVQADSINPQNIVDKMNEILASEKDFIDIGNAFLEENKIVVKSEENGEEGILIEFLISGSEITANVDISDGDDFDKAMETAFKVASSNYLIRAVAELKGYTERDCRLFLFEDSNSDEENSSYLKNGVTYENNGVELKQDENNISFKINLDTFKIDLAYIEGPKPEIIVEEITENSITYSASALVEPGTYIELYYSTDGVNFKYSMSFPYNDKENIIYNIHSNLQPNTTYYYKAVVEKSSVFSDVAIVKTLSSKSIDENQAVFPDSNDNGSNDTIENPKTGEYNNIFYLISILSFVSVMLYLIRKKDKIYNLK